MRRIRVLIADDEPHIRRGLELLLGCEETVEIVGVACDAQEAIDLAVALMPDVALLDVVMPRGGGSRAARAISRWSPATRIVALSARVDADAVTDMVIAGALRYIHKSADPDEILDAILESA